MSLALNKPTFQAIKEIQKLKFKKPKHGEIKKCIIGLFNKGYNINQINQITGYKKTTIQTMKYNYSYLIRSIKCT